MFKSADFSRSLSVLSQEGLSAQEASEQLFRFLKRYQLEDFLPNILKDFSKRAAEKKDFQSLQVFSAQELSQDGEKNLREIAGAQKTTALKLTIDKDLVGGFILRYQGKQYEGSFRRLLKQLKQ